MDLGFDIALFVFMVAIIIAQYYTITFFNDRINSLAKEVGIRQAHSKRHRNVINQKLRVVEKEARRKPRSRIKQPTYMRGELQLHRGGQTASCEATFKTKELG